MPRLRAVYRLVPLGLAAALACAEPTAGPEGPSFANAAGPTVTSTQPLEAPRDTTLDVQVNGSGFDNGSKASFELNGVLDSRVRVNSTRYVKPTQVVANVTIAADAVTDKYDVVVVTSTAKKGIGTDLFTVLLAGTMSIPGLTDPEAWDVNSSGVAVGGGRSGLSCSSGGFTWSRASGGFVLPAPVGWCNASPRVVNDAGLMAGTVSTAAGVSSFQVVRWTPNGPGTWRLDVLPRPASNLVLLTVHGVTQAGSIVSAWKNPDGTWDSWVWRDAAGWQLLAKPSGATWCSTEAMNEAEQVTGFCNGAGGSATYWASPTSSAFRLPPLAGGLSNKASAINNLGVIVGSSGVGGVVHAQRWRPDGSGGWIVEDLNALGNAIGVNNDGAIVGVNNGVAFYIPAGGVPATLDPVSTAFVAIGNRTTDGITWIVGWGPAAPQGGYRALWWKK